MDDLVTRLVEKPVRRARDITVLIMAGIVLKRIIKGLWHYYKASPAG
jgi:hypothetical protein